MMQRWHQARPRTPCLHIERDRPQVDDIVSSIAHHLSSDDPTWSIWPLTFAVLREARQPLHDRHLHRMSLVCRAWTRPARRVLLRRLCVKSIAALEALHLDTTALELVEALCVPLPWLRRVDHRQPERGEEADAEEDRPEEDAVFEGVVDEAIPTDLLADLLRASPRLRSLVLDWMSFASLPSELIKAIGQSRSLVRLVLAATPHEQYATSAEGLLPILSALPHLRRLALSTLVLLDSELATTAHITHLVLHYVCLPDDLLASLFDVCAATLVDLECEGLDETDVDDHLPFLPTHDGVLAAFAPLSTTLCRLRWIGLSAPPSFPGALVASLPHLDALDLVEADLFTDPGPLFAALSDLRRLRYLYLDERHPHRTPDDVLRGIRLGLERHPLRRLRALRLADDRYPIELESPVEQDRAEAELEGIEAAVERAGARVEFVPRRDGAAFGWGAQ